MEFPYLENVDLKNLLERITNLHTVAYKTDLQYDLESMEEAMDRNDRTENLLWISRRNGTNLFGERDVFLKETRSHNAFQSYCTRYDTPLLFLLQLKHRENHKLIGNATQLYYPQVAAFVGGNAQTCSHVLVESSAFEEAKSFSFQSYMENQEDIYATFGPFTSVQYKVDDEPNLQSLIAQNRANTIGLSKETTVSQYLSELQDYCQELYKDVEDYAPFEETQGDNEDLDR